MDLTSRQRAADTLWDAEQERTPVAPLTATWRDMSTTDAYEVQLINIRRRVDAGRTVCGHKVGLSSRAMQQMLGVDEPDYGHLLDDMFVFEGERIDADRFMQPRVEIETAFVLERPLVGPGVSVADVVRATDFVVPSIEIVDSRIADWALTIADTIADNASSGAVVLGGSPTKLVDVDIRLVGATLQHNGTLREVGASGAVLGNPAVAVAWLANKVAAFGTSLDAGDVILPGSCVRMIPVQRGDVVRADFDQLGHVSISFG